MARNYTKLACNSLKKMIPNVNFSANQTGGGGGDGLFCKIKEKNYHFLHDKLCILFMQLRLDASFDIVHTHHTWPVVHIAADI